MRDAAQTKLNGVNHLVNDYFSEVVLLLTSKQPYKVNKVANPVE